MLVVPVVSAQIERTRQLEQQLSMERAAGLVVQRQIMHEAQVAQARADALERDLDAVEVEASNLYDFVKTMRDMSAQVRDRVGLPTTDLAPLPELPARSSTSQAVSGGGLVQGVSLENDGTSVPPGQRRVFVDMDGKLVSPEVLASVPTDTGPWPGVQVQLVPVPDAKQMISSVAAAAAHELGSWQELGDAVDSVLRQRKQAAMRPSGRPAWGPITSYFGFRSGFFGMLANHTGVDISLPMGTPVAVTAGGTAVFSGVQSGYGTTVEIRHADGYLTLYGHLLRPLVIPGQSVTRGQIIALSGNSGNSTGPHLHYEIRINGTSVDPMRFW